MGREYRSGFLCKLNPTAVAAPQKLGEVPIVSGESCCETIIMSKGANELIDLMPLSEDLARAIAPQEGCPEYHRSSFLAYRAAFCGGDTVGRK